jgi:hypothetical protein
VSLIATPFTRVSEIQVTAAMRVDRKGGHCCGCRLCR